MPQTENSVSQWTDRLKAGDPAAASHFFVDYLPKGKYVFEYTTRVQQRGRYQTGFASIQCMYAPEFGGHSESLWMEAR